MDSGLSLLPGRRFAAALLGLAVGGVASVAALHAQIAPITPLQSAYQPSDYVINISGDYEAADAPRRDRHVQLAVDGDDVHLLWQSTGYRYDGRITYRGSSDGGKTWRQAIALHENENQGYLKLYEHHKALAASDGYVHAVWLGHRSGPVYSRSTDGGVTWEEIRRFYPSDTDTPNSLVIQAEGPRVVVACAIDGAAYMTGEENGNAVDVFVSTDYGANFTRRNVEFSQSGSFQMHDMALYGDEIHVMFNRSLQRLYLKSSHDLGATWGDLHLINTPVTDKDDDTRRVTRAQHYHYTPKLAVTDDYVYALWFNVDTTGDCPGYSLRLMRSDDRGATFMPSGGITLASYPNDSCADPFTGQETIIASGDNAYILRKDRNDKNIYLHVVPVAGPMQAHALTARGWGYHPVAVIDQNRGRAHFFAGWNLHTDIPLGDFAPEGLRGFINYGMQDMQRLDRPKMVVADGVVYWAGDGRLRLWADYGEAYNDIWFRRMELEPMATLPMPGEGAHYLSLSDSTEDGAVFDNVQLRSQSTLELKDRFTIALWVRSRSDTSYPILSRKRYLGENAIQFECAVGYWDQLPHARVRVVTTGMDDNYYGTILEGGLLTPGEWHHLALTYNAAGGSDNLVYYFDGEPVDQTTATGELDGETLAWWLGGYRKHGFSQANIDIDDVAFYGEALSAGEIAALTQGPPAATDPRLQALYTFDGGSLRDATGRGNDGLPMFHTTFAEGTVPYLAAPSGYLPNSVLLGEQWESQPVFGVYNTGFWPWVNHVNLGFLYIYEPAPAINWASLYVFHLGLGSWTFTAVEGAGFSYPVAYVFSLGTWGDFRMQDGRWGFLRYDDGAFVTW